MASDAFMGVASAAATGIGFAVGGPIGGAIAGSVVSAFSSIIGSSKRKKMEAQIAREKRLQAEEVARRTRSEIELLKDQLQENIGNQAVSFAASGVSVSSGASVQAQMKSFENFGRTVLNKKLEGAFKERQLRLEASMGVQLAADQARGDIIGALGGIGNTIAKIGMDGGFDTGGGGGKVPGSSSTATNFNAAPIA